MQRLKMSILIPLAIFLNACNTYAPVNDLVQCSPLITLIEDNGRRYIDEDNSTCTCRMYRYSVGYVGPVGAIWHEDLMYCNKIIGNPPEPYLELVEWLEADRLIHEGLEQKRASRSKFKMQ